MYMFGSSRKVTNILTELLSRSENLGTRFAESGTPSTVDDGKNIHSMIVGIKTLLALDKNIKAEMRKIDQITRDIYAKM